MKIKMSDYKCSYGRNCECRTDEKRSTCDLAYKPKTKMSKEQTPMNAEEFLESKGVDIDSRLQIERTGGASLTVSYLMEQYANAKVLEALEREVPIAFNEDPHNRDYPAYMGYKSGIEYYETEVKLRYQNKDE